MSVVRSLPLLLGLGRPQFVLQFLNLLVEIPLSAGQFLQPIEHLQRLAIGLRLVLLLRLVSVAVVLEFQLLELLVELLLRPPAAELDGL